MNRIVFFLIFVFFFEKCTCPPISYNKGKLTHGYRVQYLNSEEVLIPDYSVDVKIWYFNKYIIEATPLVKVVDSLGNHRWYAQDLFYTFLDLETKTYYRYSSFSDTAKMIQCCYTTTDSLGIEGGWNFFYHPPLRTKPDLDYIEDTIINGSRFKRAVIFGNDTLPDGQTIRKTNKVVYFDLSRKDTVFTLNHYLSQAVGYPVTKVEVLTKNKMTNQELRWVEQIRFEADNLTELEMKVFKKWIRNAKRNPVKYNAAYDPIYTPPY